MDNEMNTESSENSGKGSSKKSCHNCGKLEKKLDELQESVVKLHTKLNKMETKNSQYHTAIVGALAELKVFSNQLIKQEATASGVDSFFPLNSDVGLMEVESLISDDNKSYYIATVSKLWRNNVEKNIRNVLDDQIIMEYNLNGSHGKKKLLDFPKLYEVIVDSILNLPSTKAQDPTQLLRRAFQLSKRKTWRTNSEMATAKNNEIQFLDDDST